MKFSYRICLSTLVVTLSALMVAEAQAALSYALSFDKPLYMTTPGSPVTVNFLFSEISTDGTPHLLTPTNGLTRGNIGINWNGGGFAVTEPVLTNSDYGPGFNTGLDATILGSTLTLLQESSLTNGATGTVNGSSVVVAMGSAIFTGPSVGTALTTINFFDPDQGTGGEDIKIKGVISPLVESSFSYGTARIANPEPSTFILSGMGVLGAIVASRLRQRRAKKQTVVA